MGEPDLSIVSNGTSVITNHMRENDFIDGTYPKLNFDILLLGNLSNLLLPSAYNLVISLKKNITYKVADKAVMMTTIFIHEGMYLTR